MIFNCKFVIIILILFRLSVDLKRTIQDSEDISFDRFHRYKEIQNYLNKLSLTYPKFVRVRNFGNSVEKRNLTSIEICVKKYFRKPLIFIDAGIHAREWIGPALALYIINQLLENEENYDLIEYVDWLIVPLVNPDGYEYSHTVDRFWRKNRQKGNECDGVDLNRNFNFQWLQDGASNSECSNFFAGQHAFSEPESFALSKLISDNAYRIRAYITLHAAAKSILYLWAYTTNLTDNDKELSKVATLMSNTMFNITNSIRYNTGSVANVLYIGSGTSADWVYNTARVRLCYVIEIRGKDTNVFRLRFTLSRAQIFPVISEMFEAIKVLHAYVQSKFGPYLSRVKRLTIY